MFFFFPVHLIIYRYNKVQTPLFLAPPINRSSLPPLFSSPGRLMRSDNKHCRPLLPSLFSAHHSKIQEVLAPAHQQLSFHPRPPPPSPEPRWREDHEKIRTKSTDSSTSGCGKRLAPWYLWVTDLQYLSQSTVWWLEVLNCMYCCITYRRMQLCVMRLHI